jgi:dTDP-4-dehydrorhamnose 3,5-epimerase
MAFRFERLSLPHIILVHTDAYSDSRGFFMETYRASAFKANGIAEDFVQENVSHSVKGVLRGLHYQRDPHAQGKLVRCIRGEIFDVAVDVRPNSPTRGKWVSAILSGTNHDELYVPPGFAHGFCVMSDEADVAYACTAEYAPAHEAGIIWNDPAIAIEWPVASPIVSAKDSANPSFS